MGSVLTSIACPRCGGEAHSEYYYNSGEEDTCCMECGYKYEGRYKRDENRKLVTRDGTNDYRFENLIWTEKTVQPYACYHIKPKSSRISQFGSLASEEEVNEFKAQVEAKKDEIEKAYISMYDEKSKKIIAVVVV